MPRVQHYEKPISVVRQETEALLAENNALQAQLQNAVQLLDVAKKEKILAMERATSARTRHQSLSSEQSRLQQVISQYETNVTQGEERCSELRTKLDDSPSRQLAVKHQEYQNTQWELTKMQEEVARTRQTLSLLKGQGAATYTAPRTVDLSYPTHRQTLVAEVNELKNELARYKKLTSLSPNKAPKIEPVVVIPSEVSGSPRPCSLDEMLKVMKSFKELSMAFKKCWETSQTLRTSGDSHEARVTRLMEDLQRWVRVHTQLVELNSTAAQQLVDTYGFPSTQVQYINANYAACYRKLQELLAQVDEAVFVSRTLRERLLGTNVGLVTVSTEPLLPRVVEPLIMWLSQYSQYVVSVRKIALALNEVLDYVQECILVQQFLFSENIHHAEKYFEMDDGCLDPFAAFNVDVVLQDLHSETNYDLEDLALILDNEGLLGSFLAPDRGNVNAFFALTDEGRMYVDGHSGMKIVDSWAEENESLYQHIADVIANCNRDVYHQVGYVTTEKFDVNLNNRKSDVRWWWLKPGSTIPSECGIMLVAPRDNQDPSKTICPDLILHLDIPSLTVTAEVVSVTRRQRWKPTLPLLQPAEGNHRADKPRNPLTDEQASRLNAQTDLLLDTQAAVTQIDALMKLHDQLMYSCSDLSRTLDITVDAHVMCAGRITYTIEHVVQKLLGIHESFSAGLLLSNVYYLQWLKYIPTMGLTHCLVCRWNWGNWLQRQEHSLRVSICSKMLAVLETDERNKINCEQQRTTLLLCMEFGITSFVSVPPPPAPVTHETSSGRNTPSYQANDNSVDCLPTHYAPTTVSGTSYAERPVPAALFTHGSANSRQTPYFTSGVSTPASSIGAPLSIYFDGNERRTGADSASPRGLFKEKSFSYRVVETTDLYLDDNARTMQAHDLQSKVVKQLLNDILPSVTWLSKIDSKLNVTIDIAKTLQIQLQKCVDEAEESCSEIGKIVHNMVRVESIYQSYLNSCMDADNEEEDKVFWEGTIPYISNDIQLVKDKSEGLENKMDTEHETLTGLLTKLRYVTIDVFDALQRINVTETQYGLGFNVLISPTIPTPNSIYHVRCIAPLSQYEQNKYALLKDVMIADAREAHRTVYTKINQMASHGILDAFHRLHNNELNLTTHGYLQYPHCLLPPPQTPLYVAASKGRAAIVKRLLHHQTLFETPSTIIDDNIVLTTCLNGHTDVLRLLAKCNTHLDLGMGLHAACSTNKLDIIKLILEWHQARILAPKRISTGKTGTKGLTSLHIVDHSREREAMTAPRTAPSSSSSSRMIFLVDEGKFVMQEAEEEEELDDDTTEVASTVSPAVSEHSRQFDIREFRSAPNGYKPMHSAAENGNAEAIQLLIKFGANVNVADYTNCTPLHIAAKYGWLDCVNTLLKNGADRVAQDSNGYVPAMYATCRQIKCAIQPRFYSLMDELAKENCDEKVVKRLLSEKDHKQDVIDVNGCAMHGWTPLMQAITALNVGMAEMLISHGADVKAKDWYGLTANFWCLWMQHITNGAVQFNLPPTNISSTDQLALNRMMKACSTDKQTRDFLTNWKPVLHPGPTSNEFHKRQKECFFGEREKDTNTKTSPNSECSGTIIEAIQSVCDSWKVGERDGYYNLEMDTILTHARLYVTRAVAAAVCPAVTPLQTLAIYLYTVDSDVQQHISTSDNKKWLPFKHHFSTALQNLESMSCTLYCGVSGNTKTIQPDKYRLTNRITFKGIISGTQDLDRAQQLVKGAEKAVLFALHVKQARCLPMIRDAVLLNDVVVDQGSLFVVDTIKPLSPSMTSPLLLHNAGSSSSLWEANANHNVPAVDVNLLPFLMVHLEPV